MGSCSDKEADENGKQLNEKKLQDDLDHEKKLKDDLERVAREKEAEKQQILDAEKQLFESDQAAAVEREREAARLKKQRDEALSLKKKQRDEKAAREAVEKAARDVRANNSLSEYLEHFHAQRGHAHYLQQLQQLDNQEVLLGQQSIADALAKMSDHPDMVVGPTGKPTDELAPFSIFEQVTQPTVHLTYRHRQSHYLLRLICQLRLQRCLSSVSVAFCTDSSTAVAFAQMPQQHLSCVLHRCLSSISVAFAGAATTKRRTRSDCLCRSSIRPRSGCRGWDGCGRQHRRSF